MKDEAPFTTLGRGRQSRAARRARQAEADQAMVAALSRAARAAAAGEPAGPGPAAWHRLTRTRAQPLRAPRALVWAAVGAATCASVLGTVQLVRLVRPSPLTYDVRGEARQGAGQVEAGPKGTVVGFSDGTEIQLDAKARLAVSAAGPHGARLRLQAGMAHFRVMHLPRASWAVEAGPYLVEVTGTEFDVRWSEREQTAEVKMHSGSVRVSGPLLSERVALGKGQHLLARPGMGDVRIDDGREPRPAVLETSPAVAFPRTEEVASSAAAGAEAPPPVASRAAAPPSAAPPALPGPVVSPARSPRPAAPRPHALRLALSEPVAPSTAPTSPVIEPAVVPPPFAPLPVPQSPDGAPKWSGRNWSARLVAGDAPAVVADAERVGVDAAIREADAADLSALADAARYTGRAQLAERAFTATRHRFPGSSRAHTAAFLLGRMADDRGDSRGGLGWYRVYLTEAPSGPYAAEALGREMLIVQRLQDREAAVPIAREYLGRFPNGTYLLQARALIDNR